MSDRLDDRIRELYTELTDAAPPLLPLPAPGTVRHRWLTRFPVVAVSVAAVVLVLAAVPVLLTLTGDGDDAADIVGAPATTGAPAATTTTVAAAATTSAPTTTAAAATTTSGDAASETTGAPGTTSAPLGPVEALSIQCRSFLLNAGSGFSPPPVTESDYEAALDTLDGELFGLKTTAALLPAGDDRDAIDNQLDTVKQAIDDARGAFTEAAVRLSTIQDTVDNAALLLTEIGAADCTQLGGVIP